jgi:hypothetical protein
MAATTVITLPHGTWCSGAHVAQALVRPLTGDDEEFLLYETGYLTPSERSTALLARCMRRLGVISPVTPDHVRALTVGDREALLLAVRQLTFGDRIQSTVACPSAACGERVDLTLRVGDLLSAPNSTPRETYEEPFAAAQQDYLLRFRLPTGADQESAAIAAQQAVAAGVLLLLERCVVSATRLGAGKARHVRRRQMCVADLPQEIVEQLSIRMAELDPLAEIELSTICPACGHRFQTLFDAGAFLFDEVRQRAATLYEQVHTLALHYHWGESEILQLTSAKRERYLGLLLDSLGTEEVE